MTALLIFTTLAILLLACLILFFVYNNRKKQILYAESLEKIQSNYENNLLNARLEMQEQVFQHISREIHDNISLALTLAKLQLNTLDRNGSLLSDPKIDQAINLLSRSIVDLNNLSRGLNTDLLQQQGLLGAVEEEVERIQKAGLFELEFIVNGTTQYFDTRKELMIFRIIQEAFNNIIKHAKASHVTLEMNYGAEIAVMIKDNGSGFDVDMLKGCNQSGIRNMENRVKILGGHLSVSSAPGKGSCIRFNIPIEQPE